MKLRKRYIAMTTGLLAHVLVASAQLNVAFVKGSQQLAMPVSMIDSIKPTVSGSFVVFTKERNITVPSEWATISSNMSDTIVIDYHENEASVFNPRLDLFTVTADKANVSITSKSGHPFVCRATGSSSDGRLIVNADTTMTLVLDNLSLASQQASAIYLPKKQKAIIELAAGSDNTLQDAADYHPADSTEMANGCLYARGPLAFTGEGSLGVTGNYRHGIVSGKNITVEGGRLIINNVAKNGIHCDKFTMQGGEVCLTLANDASKGIKAKEEINIKGGQIEGVATGGLTIDKGDTSYNTLLKSDGTMKVSGGTITLTHHGDGGRCISVDKDLAITGGTFNLACHGDGDSYLTAENDSDYYTPKCITVDDSLFIMGGTVYCLSTGIGGKGIVAGKYLAIGNENVEEEPVVWVETQGECIINNVDEDLRFGCPKGIKADSTLIIYSGDIAVTTAGMGGEGVESNGNMFVYGGTLECNTFDDGINVTRSIEIAGGQVYCCSADNDGIDSNGSITISGGIVASVNKKKPNESFDAEKGQVFLKGGTVFGIGSSAVGVKESVAPFYSTPYDDDVSRSGGLILTESKYIYVMSGNEVMMALKNDNRSLRAFITISHPLFMDGGQLDIGEGDLPIGITHSLFDEKFVVGGQPYNFHPITNIQVQANQ